MNKKAIITGITGQDGAYLSAHLLNKGYQVTGLVRGYNHINTYGLSYLGIADKIKLRECDLTDISQIITVIKDIMPDEIYNLAAQSSVSMSFQQPMGTINFNVFSVLNLLESIKLMKPDIKFYQASSSEIFGISNELPLHENNVINPVSPYSISKATAHWICKNYRDAYGVFSCSGFLFNHESFLRGENFFVKKVIRESLKIKEGKADYLEVGNIDVKRDFGWAPKYVEAMYLMLQQKVADDFFICSGTSVSLRSIIEFVFEYLNIEMDKVVINPDFYRPTEIQDIYGDNTKAKTQLGWHYEMSFYDVLKILIDEEISFNQRQKIKVTFFQRRPRKGFSFSLEYIFSDVRDRLKDKIEATVKICKLYNNGYFTKLYNIVEAGFRQSKGINHVTGEVHFINLLMRKKNVLLTVLDCGMVHRKQGLAKSIITSLYLTLPVRNSKYVTAISEMTKQEIVRYTGCNPEKIVVIPVAVSDMYQPHPKEFNEAKPTILHIGTGYNKNLFRLLDALKSIPCHLTIVGKLDQTHLEILEQNKIDFSNEYNISNERLLEKYIECDLLSFISTFEGFGMPIVEANAVERVVITSNISSMPEVAGDAACLVNPFEVEDIKKGMLRLIDDKSYREELLKKGRENKKRFDANAVANRYYELYKKLYAKKGNFN